jgi:hypothetical protein
VLREAQPGLRIRRRTVGAKRLEQARREQRRAVPRPLALLHPDQAPLGVDVANPKRHELAHPQACRVRGEQKRSVLRPQRLREQPRQLGVGEHDRKPRGLARDGDEEARGSPPQRRVVEEAQRSRRLVAGAVAQASVPVQVHQVVLHRALGDPIWRPPAEPGEAGHGAQVGLLGVGRETAQGHVLDHLLA